MNKFKKLRLLAGKSAEEAAKEIGMSAASIYKWEAGKFNPNPRKFSVIARVYNCSVSAIVEAYEAQN